MAHSLHIYNFNTRKECTSTKIWFHVFNVPLSCNKVALLSQENDTCNTSSTNREGNFAPVQGVLKHHIVVVEERLKEVHFDPLDIARVVQGRSSKVVGVIGPFEDALDMNNTIHRSIIEPKQ